MHAKYHNFRSARKNTNNSLEEIVVSIGRLYYHVPSFKNY